MLATNRFCFLRYAGLCLLATAAANVGAVQPNPRNGSFDSQIPLEPVAQTQYGEDVAAAGCCDTNACDRGGCGGCSRCSRSRIYGSIEAVFFGRDHSDWAVPLVIDVNSDATLRSTADLDFDLEPGIRATVGLVRAPCSFCSAWEFTYLGISEGAAATAVTGDNNLAVPGDLGFAVNGFTLAESIRTEYRSTLQSGEANCVKCFCEQNGCNFYRRVDWFVGLRYLSLNEDLAILGNNLNVADALYDVHTTNDLYGPQIGTRIRTIRGCWGWELSGRGGFFANDMTQRQTIVDELGVNDFVVRNASDSDTCPAFVGEIGVTLLMERCGWGLRCGYNLLWVANVALATEQLDFSDTITSGTVLQSGESSVSHGFSVGAEFGW